MAQQSGSRKLQVTLPSDTEILLRREFEAPAHLVYEAMTRPEFVKRWWNCIDGNHMPVCEIDLRVGGRWRFVSVDPSGAEHGFHGVYTALEPSRRIVHTEIYEPFPMAEVVVTITLEAQGARTLLTSLTTCPDPQTRDAIVSSGMEWGADIAYDRLEEVARGQLAASSGTTSGMSTHSTI